ncbi:MAG: hypothetical protein K6U11_12685 [bacterium]|nr:hypothetical protein [bacterium]
MLVNLKKHAWAVVIILSFLILSYLIISSDYRWVHGDAGVYARSAKILYETKRIDISYSAASLIGQLFFSNLLCHLFGFKLKILHLSVYVVNFLALLALYLLLSELGLSRFLAVCGALTMLINPISLKMIDWYMTEPFFMFYLIASILFMVKGLRYERPLFLYLGSTLAILAVLTRQHAVSLSVALAALGFIEHKVMKKKILIHSLIASALPIIAIGLFYLCLLSGKIIQSRLPYTTAVSSNLAIIKSLTNPWTLISRLYFDGLFSLHYSAVFIAPLLITFVLALLTKPGRIKTLRLNFPLTLASALLVSIGTMILYLKDSRLMPYLPSIFSIGALTRVFNFQILSPDQASLILTGFSLAGAIAILTILLEHFLPWRKEINLAADKRKMPNKRGSKRAEAAAINRCPREDRAIKQPSSWNEQKMCADLGSKVFYLWGVSYLLVAIFIGLSYDRYLFPLSILMIYALLSRFPRIIGEQRETLVITLALIYSLFIFQVASHRLSLDLEWTAGESLIRDGVQPCAINAGLGFNHFYNFDCLTDLYQEIRVGRPINWYKFHPLAEFFITGQEGLEHKHQGLKLYQTFVRKRLFGLLEGKCYIYQRKTGFQEPIWI